MTAPRSTRTTSSCATPSSGMPRTRCTSADRARSTYWPGLWGGFLNPPPPALRHAACPARELGRAAPSTARERRLHRRRPLAPPASLATTSRVTRFIVRRLLLTIPVAAGDRLRRVRCSRGSSRATLPCARWASARPTPQQCDAVPARYGLDQPTPDPVRRLPGAARVRATWARRSSSTARDRPAHRAPSDDRSS